MQQWMIYTKRADFNALSEKYGISPVLARIMINRGVTEADFDTYLHGSFENLHSAHQLPDIDKAAGFILNAIADNKKIRVVGDYDVDGVCSTYILITGLKRLGAEVTFDIPDRVRDGYGINTKIIKEANDNGVELIVTCDNGIAAVDAIALAKECGMTVVLTDHHEPPEILPAADAIVNPKLRTSAYPYQEICGGMVAFKLIDVLYERAGIPAEELKKLIEFAALATVSDVMPLCDENRIIVKEGLKRIPYTESTGLRKLIGLCGLDIRHLSAYSIGFVIGPCLNASGRLESAKTALSLLMTEDETEAEEIANHLRNLNDERKNMTEDFTLQAVRKVDEEFSADAVKVIYLPGCHESVAGIIAGRLKEHYHHPCIVLTDGSEGFIKGSARSIEGYNMFEKLTEAKDFLTKFGGHKMAAGMTLKKENLDAFRKALNENAGLSEEDFIEKIWIDVALPFRAVNENLIKELELMEPFGQGNEKPAFALKDVEIVSAKVLGHNRSAVGMKLKDAEGTFADGIMFTDADEFLAKASEKRTGDVLYYPQINEFRGKKSIQIVIKSRK